MACLRKVAVTDIKNSYKTSCIINNINQSLLMIIIMNNSIALTSNTEERILDKDSTKHSTKHSIKDSTKRSTKHSTRHSIKDSTKHSTKY